MHYALTKLDMFCVGNLGWNDRWHNRADSTLAYIVMRKDTSQLH